MGADLDRDADLGHVLIGLRRAELRDVQSIRGIDAKAYPRRWSEKMTIEQTTGNGRIHFVAEQDHRVIAHGGIAVLADVAHVTTVAVAPMHQRRGIATVLMRRLFEAAKANGCEEITLEVRAGNEGAIALYERLGFESAGVRPGYYGDNGEDALILWRSLDA